MNHRFSILLMGLSLLVALVGVAAAPTPSGTTKLVSVEYVPQKGPVFTFEVSGKFSRSALKGTVFVQGGGSYPLYCTQIDDTTVKCNTSQKVEVVNVSLTWGGFTFWTFVPGAPEPVEKQERSETGTYCYTIYDYDLDYVWHSYGNHCQDVPPQYNDAITYYNPDWEEDSEVWFLPEGPTCSELFGDAYYYPWCPEEFAD